MSAKYIPILFSTSMVEAILAGAKTQTRRVVKPQHQPAVVAHNEFSMNLGACPYGKPGDILWVREAYSPDYFGEYAGNGNHAYKSEWSASAKEFVPEPKWKPSIHMPKAACRIFLRVTNVRVELLHSITEEDARAEGVETLGLYPLYTMTSKEKYSGLWNSIHGDEAWDANPWVWVITFERIEKPEGWPL